MKSIKLWPGMVFGLIGLNMCVVGATVYLAHADRSVAVEPDYYRKALAWDQTRDEQARSDALGWTVDVQPGAAAGASTAIAVLLTGPEGSPVQGLDVQLEAFANTRSAERRHAALFEVSPGRYAGVFEAGRSGLWQFRVTATRGSDRFVARVERLVDPPRSRTP